MHLKKQKNRKIRTVPSRTQSTWLLLNTETKRNLIFKRAAPTVDTVGFTIGKILPCWCLFPLSSSLWNLCFLQIFTQAHCIIWINLHGIPLEVVTGTGISMWLNEPNHTKRKTYFLENGSILPQWLLAAILQPWGAPAWRVWRVWETERTWVFGESWVAASINQGPIYLCPYSVTQSILPGQGSVSQDFCCCLQTNTTPKKAGGKIWCYFSDL